jgi:hypothetical protein
LSKKIKQNLTERYGQLKEASATLILIALISFYAVPGAIVNLGIKDIRDSSARLTWQPPENFNGQFVKYVVRYQVLIKKVGIIN